MNWIEQYKEIVKSEGLNGRKMSEILKLNYGYHKQATMKKQTRVATWIIAFVVGYTLGKNSK